MKVVILAGGMGTRMGEDAERVPKPMVEIGGRPMLWHIMKLFARQGHDEFIVCLGHKGYAIKEYFANYHLHHSSTLRFDFPRTAASWHNSYRDALSFTENVSVVLMDTGDNAGTGTRMRMARDTLKNETFLMTYGDGLADIDIPALIASHRASGALATVTAVRPPGRFGALNIDDGNVVFGFKEKPQGEGRINGGFFVLEPGVFDYIPDYDIMWEQGPLETLARDGQLNAYLHDGFWQCMDTPRDRALLEELWKKGAPWEKPRGTGTFDTEKAEKGYEGA